MYRNRQTVRGTRKKVNLKESELKNIIKNVIKETTHKAYDYNSIDKARKIEALINNIRKCAERISNLTNDESEYGGEVGNAMYFASNVINLCDSCSFSASDYEHMQGNPDSDMRDLGNYGTDRNGNWIYDYPEGRGEDRAFDYWLDRTTRGRKYNRNLQKGGDMRYANK